jgi:hypothetical protein
LILTLDIYFPQVFETCTLQRRKHIKSWLVYLATGTKQKVTEIIESFLLEMNGLHTCETLNLLPFGSYDMHIGMDWLASHKEKMNFFIRTYNVNMMKATKE